ncbi:hypothetical protein [Haloglomus litoreum]|uniref:hypothetical protein n=1 Tax=Haloglomus litoreum TaxID=3034026 RepID=UPI0023E80CE2|nr:hypothetical protein [Haloglomus sp. DT116]
MTDPAPEAWTEVERPPHVVGKYDPRQPTLFEHGGRDLAVHVLPDATRPTGTGVEGADTWRVGLVRGSATEFQAVEPVAEAVEGRDRALTLARRVMRACTRSPELSLSGSGDTRTRWR